MIRNEQRRAGLRHIDLITTILVIVRCAWIFAAPLRSADLPLHFAQDDFFYYLKPAQNLAWLHRSTFDGTTLTNGYHPLYFVLITAASLFVHTIPGIFRALWVLDTLSATAIFLLTRRLFSRVSSPILSNGFALAVTLLCIPLLCDQMEVTLALPLGFAFLLTGFVDGPKITPRRSAALGLLGALTFLARLDAGILVFCYVASAFCTREYRAAFTPRNLASFLGTCLPLPAVYLWMNYHFFRTILPISGRAKELRHGWKLSLFLPASFNGRSELLLNVAVIAAVLAWALRRYLRTREKVFLFTVLATPFVFYTLEMIVSDWPIWNWYFYDLRFAAAGALLLAGIFISRHVLGAGYPQIQSWIESERSALVILAAVVVVLCTIQYKIDHWMVEIQHAAGVLDDFEQSHPGKYAMGDRAGMFAITTTSPVLQTEGLVMDRTYLEHIRAQDDLRSVLSSYGVNYYVAFVFDRNYYWQFSNHCFHALEPSIAGPDSLRMRSDFCEIPIFEFPGSDGKYLIYQINHT